MSWFTHGVLNTALVGIGLTLLSGCAAYGHHHPYGGQPRIPEGHKPPPGSCRIWYPDLPPGQQPPPGHCDELRYRVPPDAYLIRG